MRFLVVTRAQVYTMTGNSFSLVAAIMSSHETLFHCVLLPRLSVDVRSFHYLTNIAANLKLVCLVCLQSSTPHALVCFTSNAVVAVNMAVAAVARTLRLHEALTALPSGAFRHNVRLLSAIAIVVCCDGCVCVGMFCYVLLSSLCSQVTKGRSNRRFV